MSGTIVPRARRSNARPHELRADKNCVAAANAIGTRMSRTSASMNGSGSMANAISDPRKTRRYNGSRTICASISRGAAASSRSADPPASPANTIT
jgi:hypothetical protein